MWWFIASQHRPGEAGGATGKGLAGTPEGTHGSPAACVPPTPPLASVLGSNLPGWAAPPLLYQQDLEAFGEVQVVMKPIQ